MRLNTRYIRVPKLLEELMIDTQTATGSWQGPCPQHQAEWFKAHNTRVSEGSWYIKDNYGKPNNGVHHCFGCGFKGNAIQLVCDVIGVGFSSAIEFIQEKCMGKPTPSMAIKVAVSPLVKQGFRLPKEAIFEPLALWPASPRTYLQDRNVTPEQVDKWALGYALTGRLAGRIIIPIYNGHGKPCSYTGRTYNNSLKRYLEPTKEENPDNSGIFGESDWPQLDYRQTVIVTEGAFDALAVERANPMVAIAGIQGSQVTATHILKLSTFKLAVILTDNDFAGNKAAATFEATFARHIDYVRIKLDAGVDANKMKPEDLQTILGKYV